MRKAADNDLNIRGNVTEPYGTESIGRFPPTWLTRSNSLSLSLIPPPPSQSSVYYFLPTARVYIYFFDLGLLGTFLGE